MKKVLCWFLMILITVTLCACAKEKDPDVSSTDSLVSDSAVSEEEASDPYKGIEQRKIGLNDWKSIGFTHDDGDKYVNFKVPKDWTVVGDADPGFNIERGGNVIGTITSSPLSPPVKKYEYETSTFNETTTEYAVYETEADGVKQYQHVFELKYIEDHTITRTIVAVDYAELDNAAKLLIQHGMNLAASSKSIKGDFTLNKNDTSKRILFVGNSFIPFSDVGQFLRQFLAKTGKNYEVVEEYLYGSKGMSGDYPGQYWVDQINAGYFTAVFRCGFYSSDEMELFEEMKEACDATDTLMVIFPAHNESQTVIDSAIAKFPDTAVVNWKKEINDLISAGVSYDDFCINDIHKHSTQLAGYVGAHMIYRALFGSIPPEIEGVETTTMSYIKDKLGSYVSTGVIDVDAQSMFDEMHSLN